MKKTRVWPALLAALVILAGCAAAPPEESDPPTEEFVFTRENMPRLNGSTSAVPWRRRCAPSCWERAGKRWPIWSSSPAPPPPMRHLWRGRADLLLPGEPEQAVMERLEAGDRVAPDPLRHRAHWSL